MLLSNFNNSDLSADAKGLLHLLGDLVDITNITTHVHTHQVSTG
jgi:hypothetical protein